MGTLGRWLRRRVAPLLFWLLLIAGCVWLAIPVVEEGQVLGVAHATLHPLGAVGPARVLRIHVGPGDEVAAGQVLAELDPAAVEAAIAVARAERVRVRDRITAEGTRARDRLRASQNTLEAAVEEAEAGREEARARLGAKEAELEAVATQRERIQELVDKRVIQMDPLIDLEIQHATLGRVVTETRRTLALREAHLQASRKRLQALPDDAEAVAVAPLQRELAVWEARLLQLAEERAELTLKAPAAGEVLAVHLAPGAVSNEGRPVVTVVVALPDEVLTFFPPALASSAAEGAAVILYGRDSPRAPLTGRVVRAGAAIEEVPLRHQPVTGVPAFGRRVVVRLDDPAAAAGGLIPGEGFTIAIGGHGSLWKRLRRALP